MMNKCETTRRGFLALLGALAGASIVPDAVAGIDPTPDEIEAAERAGRPVSGEVWIEIYGQYQRLGRLHALGENEGDGIIIESTFPGIKSLSVYMVCDMNPLIPARICAGGIDNLKFYIGDLEFLLKNTMMVSHSVSWQASSPGLAHVEFSGGSMVLEGQDDE